jgi:hypothetical protein
MQHISALNLPSFRLKFLNRNLERYVWNSALDVPNCRRSFRSHASTYSLYFECGYLDCLDWQSWHPALKHLKNNLRHPFENCDFTSLLCRITAMETSRHKHCNKKHAHTRCGRMWVCAPCLGQTQHWKISICYLSAKHTVLRG